MLHTLVLGLGRSGSGLHLRALSKARDATGGLFHPGPVVAYDSDPDARQRQSDVVTTHSVGAAAELLPPDRTVAHVCTPPTARAAVLAELAEHGFRRIIVEKPLATGTDELRVIRDLRRRHGLDLAVVAHWLDAELTGKLGAVIRRGELGELRSIAFAQHKPRFARSLATEGHPTAFDVEIPHSLGVVLHLAGAAELVDAELADMRCAQAVIPRIGSARLALRHRNGTTSEISSDLTSPVQERRITLDFTGGRATGHYPISAQDEHAQLVVDGERQVFADDALTRFMTRAYRHFHRSPRGDHGTFDLHCEITRLVADAKQRSVRNTAMAPEGTVEHAR
ncbi:Gfo/Idh/MocA family protein [Parasphingorhabdus pacifica]